MYFHFVFLGFFWNFVSNMKQHNFNKKEHLNKGFPNLWYFNCASRNI